jgi:hypothetical protein
MLIVLTGQLLVSSFELITHLPGAHVHLSMALGKLISLHESKLPLLPELQTKQ